MQKINWTVRLQNKQFVLSLASFIILNAQVVAVAMGYKFDLDAVTGVVVAVVNIIFGLLAFAGIVQDPTTQGYGDSERALNYTEPN